MTELTLAVTPGQRIKVLREAMELSQADLADLLRVHEMTVSKWERGEQVPSGPKLQGLAKELGTTPAYILTGDNPLRDGEGGLEARLPAVLASDLDYREKQLWVIAIDAIAADKRAEALRREAAAAEARAIAMQSEGEGASARARLVTLPSDPVAGTVPDASAAAPQPTPQDQAR